MKIPTRARADLLTAAITAAITTAITAAVVACGPAPQPQAAPATASAPASETLTPLLEQALPNVQGRTFTSAIVTFPPGASAAPHRHGDAFLYVYVLQGAVRSQLEGEPERTYGVGQNWTEPPGAHHIAAQNTSATQPAKLLVVFVSPTGAQLKTDDSNN